MNKYGHVNIFISMALFIVLVTLGAISIILGFYVIDLAETTTIKKMTADDWVLVLRGSVLVFGSFVFLNMIKIIREL
jgi:hypothetical protein